MINPMKLSIENNPVAAPSRSHIPSIDIVLADDSPPTTSALPAILVGVGIITIFVFGVIAWCVYVPLGASLHAPGELVFQGKRQAVQHLEGGIVGRILVRDGDFVAAGQPLIELERKQVLPLVHMLEEQSVAEAAYNARLEAESSNLTKIKFPESANGKAAQTESRLFQARRDAFNNQLELTNLQINQIKESIKGLKERLSSKETEIGIVQEQFNANQTLQKDGYVPRTVILDLQRQLAAMTGDRESIIASLASEQQRTLELEQRIVSLKSDRIQGAVNEQKQSNLRRIDLQERIRPVRDTLDRQIIRAPVAGKVVGMKVATVGGVINPRETLMEIVPTDDQLIIEAKIKVENISDVRVGQSADVTITGLDPRKIPFLKAKVIYISDDRIIPPPSQGPLPYYSASLVLDHEEMKKFDDIRLRPGMPAQVSIAIKPRSAFNLMIEPLMGHARKAIHAK